MRLKTKFTLIAVALLTLTACQKEEKAAPAPVLETEQAKQAYSLGVSAGRYLQSTVDEYGKIAVDLNAELILRGVQDGMAGKSEVSEEDIQQLLSALDETYRTEQASWQKPLRLLPKLLVRLIWMRTPRKKVFQ